MEYRIWFADMAGKEMLRIMCEKRKVLTYVKNKANMLELILRINYGMNYWECNEREGKKKGNTRIGNYWLTSREEDFIRE